MTGALYTLGTLGWRVYGMRLEMLADGSAQSVRDRLLAEGLNPAADGD